MSDKKKTLDPQLYSAYSINHGLKVIRGENYVYYTNYKFKDHQ